MYGGPLQQRCNFPSDCVGLSLSADADDGPWSWYGRRRRRRRRAFCTLPTFCTLLLAFNYRHLKRNGWAHQKFLRSAICVLSSLPSKSDINFVGASAPYQDLGSIATLKSGRAHCSLEICDPVHNMVPLISAIGSYWHWASLPSPLRAFQSIAFHFESINRFV